MMKRWIILVAAMMTFWGHAAPASLVAGHGNSFTLIVLPARYSVMQVAFDVIAKRNAVLVSYQISQKSTEPLLHAWSGQEWVALTMQDYQQVSFLEKMPTHVILIGDDATLPASLVESTAWSSDVTRITDLGNASLVNEFGKIFKWTPVEWQWFSARYNLNLADKNEGQRKTSWYDQQGPLHR